MPSRKPTPDDYVARAWRVSITTWPEIVLFYASKKRSWAITASWAAARDAGYDVPFTDFRARRAPERDEDANDVGGTGKATFLAEYGTTQ